MRSLAFRGVLLSLPVMIVLGFTEDVRAQNRGWGIGVGVGGYYGSGHRYGVSPYWGPGWGFMPNYYQGTWGNGLSMYGPPVPTGHPTPGAFGGGDSQFFPLPPYYPGWMYEVYIPLSKPAPLPQGVLEPEGAPVPLPLLPPPALEKPAAMQIEVHVPYEDATVFMDGKPTASKGLVRVYESPVVERAITLTYDIRAEWTVDGFKTTHSKRVSGQPGEHVVVEFAK
jgi:uncharacterized protein (TIGR03000 family)